MAAGWLQHAPAEGEALAPARYHKIGHDAAAIEALFVTLFLEAHAEPPEERWPKAKIRLRADSGFAREQLMA